jgi:TonB-linked SusC/RagA family outer membrane protein
MKISTNVRRIALFFLSMVLSLGFAIAQERTITGTVTADGEGSVPGVNILIKGTMTGAITDVNGAFSIKVPGDATVLVFSSVGYVTQEVTVGSQAVIDVVLATDVVSLQEVVVTGYTTQRKRDITGAIGVVESDKLKAIPTGNVSNQLQGRSSGVTVTGSGQPGQNSKVRIRGFASFQDNNPLYIVDGVPTQDISSLNPNDVESLSVLKDAGAASVYGSRASNGVIIVTTKSGGKGIKVNYDMYTGTQYAGKGPDNLLNSQEYANLQWLVYANDGTTETHPLYGASTNASPTLPSWAADTKWYDVITHNAPMQNHDISLSGGNDKARFFAGLGYFNQEGIIITNYSKRYTGRFNSEWTFLNDRVKVGENLTVSYRESNGVSNQEEGSPIQSGPYRSQAIIPYIITEEIAGTARTFVPGEYGGTAIAPRLGNGGNTYAGLIRGADDTHHNIHFIGSTYVDVQILKGLNFRSTFGGTWDDGYNVDYTYATYENAENTATPSLSEYAYWGSDWVWTNQLSFNKTFGQHRINAIAGYEAVKYGIGRNMTAGRAGYYTNALDFRTLNNGATIQTATSDAYTPTTLVSMFGKADYSFQDKYLLSATVRRDGSSRFGADQRYGVFPSFSAGWRVSGEPFFSSIGWISDLKVRGSYGTMGNQLAVSPDNQFYLYGGSANQSNYDLNGTGTSSLQGFRPTRIGNPDAKWETNVTTNIGFEAQFWNNKLGVVFDYYTKNTEDLLYDPELPGTAGAASPPYVNIASMKNNGVDLEISFKNTWGDLGVNASATLTSYHNEITKIADGITFFDYGDSRIGSNSRNMVGQPISAFYGYQVEGLFQSQTEIDGAPVQDGAEPGFFRYANLEQTANEDGDQVIGPEDRTFIGNPNPKFTYGFNLGFTYKNWDLTTFIYGSYGNDILNFNTWWIDFWPSFQGQKSTELLYDSWTPDRTNTDVPKASNHSTFSNNTVWNSYYVEDGSFLRMKNLTLGYTLPESLLGKVGVKSLRVYLQGVNLFTLTKYSGLDPEIGSQYTGSTNDRNFGVDYGNYPSVRQFLIGLNLGL